MFEILKKKVGLLGPQTIYNYFKLKNNFDL